MELFPAMTRFYEAIDDDVRIGTTHISLYMALLQQWNLNGGINPVIIVRVTIMKVAKINARYTYNKCMKNLHEFGYIKYIPSNNCIVNSIVYLKGLQ
jgi:replication initiation and membrane attachment protein DnaB